MLGAGGEEERKGRQGKYYLEEESNLKGYVRYCPCLLVMQIPKVLLELVLTQRFTKILFTTVSPFSTIKDAPARGH